jgi:ribosomal-protein-alanine N-acetyltransferase
VVPFWRRAPCSSVGGQRCRARLNRQSVRRLEERLLILPETIRTARLMLRPFSLHDGPAVLEYSRDSDWTEYQQTTPSSEREAARVVADLLRRDWHSQPAWAITRSGVVVGLVSLAFSAQHRIALLGYGIHKDHRGLGLTEEAVRAVLGEAFAVHQGLTRITANTDARNHPSIHLLEKLGFTREGTLRLGGVTAKGDLVDGAIYGLLRSDWEVCTR